MPISVPIGNLPQYDLLLYLSSILFCYRCILYFIDDNAWTEAYTFVMIVAAHNYYVIEYILNEFFRDFTMKLLSWIIIAVDVINLKLLYTYY